MLLSFIHAVKTFKEKVQVHSIKLVDLDIRQDINYRNIMIVVATKNT